MPVGLTEEHRALADSLSGLAQRHAPVELTRQNFEALAAGKLPGYWKPLLDSGLLTLHLPEAVGGGGTADGVDLAVVVEEAGRSLLPGPFVPTVLAGAVLTRAGAGDDVLRRLADGATAACASGADGLRAQANGDGGWHVTGTSAPLLGASGADVLLLGAAAADGDVWLLLDPVADAGVTVTQLAPVDVTRSVGEVTVDTVVPAARVLTSLQTGTVRAVAAAVFAAEASGVARWCFDTALAYAKVREQFGRLIGSFQAVKHKAANVFARVEVLAAAAWDAARALDEDDDQLALAAAEAVVTTLRSARDVALDCVTLLGGIGYTWEHDIALYERRAVSLGQAAGSPSRWAREISAALPHAVRRFGLDATDEDPAFRASIAQKIAEAAVLAEPERRYKLVDHGLVSPQYPRPYGIEATPAQQLVIQQEYAKAGLVQPSTVIGAFALPAVIAHGSAEQLERFLPPSLRGDIVWCQLFSEPGAGSDLASLRTQAVKVDGGWKLNGQKVWNSMADRADWGICLARTDPDAPKHQGISYFLVDMRTPGVEARPLRQTTGEAEFNEVFLTDVFVPDDCLVGTPGEGWKIATTTLANERLMIASGFGRNPELDQLRELAATPEVAEDPAAAAAVGTLAAENFALAALNLRSVQQQLSGLNPGATSSVQKLAMTEHKRQLASVALELSGRSGVVESDGPLGFLRLPSVLLGGGTREIQLNVVSERVLGLPRG